MPSSEIVSIYQLDYASKCKKDIILSTGMNDMHSIKNSVKIIKKFKCPLAILHNTNLYPTPTNLIRSNALNNLRKKFPNIQMG